MRSAAGELVPPSRRQQLRGLLLSCHPAPTVAVTVFSIVLALAADVRPGVIVLLAIAVITGQLSIGWSNDLIDSNRDARVGRTDKPIAVGMVLRSNVIAVLGCVLALTVVFSMLLGWRAGIVHLAAVACGWAYNLGLKRTAASWVPYGLAFGALPAVATFAAPDRPAPAAWAVAAGALLGVAAHFANVLPDIAGDLAEGVRGLPHRFGARASALIAVVLLLSGTSVATFGPPGPPRWPSVIALGVQAVAVVAAVPYINRRPDGRVLFKALMVLAGLDIVAIAIAGSIAG